MIKYLQNIKNDIKKVIKNLEKLNDLEALDGIDDEIGELELVLKNISNVIDKKEVKIYKKMSKEKLAKEYGIKGICDEHGKPYSLDDKNAYTVIETIDISNIKFTQLADVHLLIYYKDYFHYKFEEQEWDRR